MKRWIHSTDKVKAADSEKSSNPKKLKRTPESGHSYEGSIVFDSVEDMLKWCEEDKLYED